ncbi:phenylalanine--tRNA ligase subunit beta [bacterium]|nr:MAG: phenylalanine--tRNA ligase subunit beta [bacterium]
MKVSYNWLKELVDLPVGPDALADKLLHLGMEAASITKLGPQFTGVVVGEVRTKEKHPNADRLSLCTVFDGSAEVGVVCGAPNVAAGQRIAFAKVGAVLPGDFVIKKAKIRGAASEGMICSTKELGLPSDGVDGIMVLPSGAPVGTDFASTLGPSDAVLDVEIGPNRPDCLSHVGLARELAVHFGLPLKAPAAAAFPELGPAPLPVDVSDAEGCRRYTGRLVTGVKVGPSPEWLKKRLLDLGLRSINAAVDVTNLLLMENGQPLHVFDADKLAGGRLTVRRAAAGERLKGLDGKEHELTPEDLVIADAAGPVAVAGVVGGVPTGVTEATKNVFIECARFHPGRVRRTAKRLAARTDSSVRFERGVDPAAQAAAAKRAAGLLLELCGGTAGPLSDTAPAAPARPTVRVSAAQVNALLGTRYPAPAVEDVLKRLAADARPDGDGLSVTAPSWRLDLNIAPDYAEEVGRHLGFASIPEEAAPARLPVPVSLPVPALSETLSQAMAGLGFQEACCYDFLSEPELDRLFGASASLDRLDRGVTRDDLARLLNPLSADWAALRPTLLGGLLRSAVLNQNRGASGGRLFEAGRVYTKAGASVCEGARLSALWWGADRAHWKRSAAAPDVHEARGLAAALLRGRALEERPGAATDGVFHPKASVTLCVGGKTVGRLGELHPELLRRWELRGAACALELDLDALAAAPAPAPRYAAVSPFPGAERDLSLLVPADLEFGRLDSAFKALKLEALSRLELVDVFKGAGVPEGKVSWTVRLSLSLPDRTLSDAELQTAAQRAAEAAATLGASLRS